MLSSTTPNRPSVLTIFKEYQHKDQTKIESIYICISKITCACTKDLIRAQAGLRVKGKQKKANAVYEILETKTCEACHLGYWLGTIGTLPNIS